MMGHYVFTSPSEGHAVVNTHLRMEKTERDPKSVTTGLFFKQNSYLCI